MKPILVAFLFAVLSVSPVIAKDWADDALATITTAVKAKEYERALELAKAFAEKNAVHDAPGRKLLQQILDEDSLRCTLLDDAQFWIGVSYNWERDVKKTAAAFEVLLRDFSCSQSAKQVVGKYSAAGPLTR